MLLLKFMLQDLAVIILDNLKNTRQSVYETTCAEEFKKKHKNRSSHAADDKVHVDNVKQLTCNILDLSHDDFNDIMSVTIKAHLEDRQDEFQVILLNN